MGRLSNETRFGIVTDYFVFGMKQIDIAMKYGCTQASVYSVTTMFNLVKEEQYAELKECALSRSWGVEGIKWAFNALNKIPPIGYINDLEKSLKAKRAGRQTAPEPKEEHKAEPDTNLVEVVAPEEPPNGTKINIPAPTAETGWQTRIKVKPDRLTMTVYFNGVAVCEGHSRIKENKELALMQAISYAAHMCYKITEQKKLGGR